MSAQQLFVVRRCDGFYRFWHDITAPAPIGHARAVYDRLTQGGRQNVAPDDNDYYDIVQANPLPAWRDGHPPQVRRLHKLDTQAIQSHLLGLNNHDRRLRFFREVTDMQIRAYVHDIDWNYSLLLGAIRDERIVGIAEALFCRTSPPRHAEIAVSVDLDVRGCGLGGFLVANVIHHVGVLGVSQTSLSFLRENRPIQRIVRTLGGHVDLEELVGTIPVGDFEVASGDDDRRFAA